MATVIFTPLILRGAGTRGVPLIPKSGGAFEYTAIANNFSMDFDSASSQYIQTNVDLAYTTFPNISLACWVKMNKSDLSNFTIYYPVGVNAPAFPNGSPIRVYAKNLSAGGSTVIVVQGSTSAETSTDLSDGNWHHIVQTCEYDSGGTICNVYVDGTKEITNHLLRSYAPLTGNLFIGSRNSTSNFFEGEVDEVAVWSLALSESTIQAIYNTTANNPGKVADLSETPEGVPIAWYRMGD